MSLYKQLKDQLVRRLLNGKTVPSGLVELHQYFRMYDPIVFEFEKQDDGSLIALSKNFRYGKIITRAAKDESLDVKITDAILTAFEVPSSYAKEAGLQRIGQDEYAFA